MEPHPAIIIRMYVMLTSTSTFNNFSPESKLNCGYIFLDVCHAVFQSRGLQLVKSRTPHAEISEVSSILIIFMSLVTLATQHCVTLYHTQWKSTLDDRGPFVASEVSTYLILFMA